MMTYNEGIDSPELYCWRDRKQGSTTPVLMYCKSLDGDNGGN